MLGETVLGCASEEVGLRMYPETEQPEGDVRLNIQVYSHIGSCKPHLGYLNRHRLILADPVGFVGAISHFRSWISVPTLDPTPSPWSPVDSCSKLLEYSLRLEH